MFILFEVEIPNNVPQQYMYVPDEDNNEQDTSEITNSEMSGMAALGEQEPPEAGPPPEQAQGEAPPGGDETSEEQIQQELEPLKKLYLLQKLTKLNDVLEDNSYIDPKLKLVVKYGANLSYQTLLTISNKITQGIKNTIEPEVAQAQASQPPVQGG